MTPVCGRGADPEKKRSNRGFAGPVNIKSRKYLARGGMQRVRHVFNGGTLLRRKEDGGIAKKAGFERKAGGPRFNRESEAGIAMEGN